MDTATWTQRCWAHILHDAESLVPRSIAEEALYEQLLFTFNHTKDLQEEVAGTATRVPPAPETAHKEACQPPPRPQTATRAVASH